MLAIKKVQELPHEEEKSFIEVQFPISKLSKEAYKERKAGSGQTLTGLGRWWGRKPLILIRAIIIGILLPASKDPTKDRDIFLKILTMDEEGLWRRKSKALPPALIYEKLKKEERSKYFSATSSEKSPKFLSDISSEDKKKAERITWQRLSYDEKLRYCCRPEEIDGPSEKAWKEINSHLGTKASSLPELIKELGKRRFGHVPRVGDAFCGGGSVPFEAARLGCDAFGSDLNPIAALLTWGALNILGADKEKIQKSQEEILSKVDVQITKWKIEHNEEGWRADIYLYCNETTCPECGWEVPLSPSWVIDDKNKVIAKLKAQPSEKRFEIEIITGTSTSEMSEAKHGTVGSYGLKCPHCKAETSIKTLRGDRVIKDIDASGNEIKTTKYGLRLWENDDIIPRENDVFRERLYCIRWLKPTAERLYRAPTKNDLEREKKVLSLLKERFHEWQKKGYIPSMKIEPGYVTNEVIRQRGWTHWHNLFNPRQLLTNGLIAKFISEEDAKDMPLYLLLQCRMADYNSRLSRWDKSVSISHQTFYNQALNTLYNYAVRSVKLLYSTIVNVKNYTISGQSKILPEDARKTHFDADLWITDPPYADAVNYHELSEFFLAWIEKSLEKAFPNWSTKSRRALAIKGKGSDFKKGMIGAYKHLTYHLNDSGKHLVMFTHQDAAVWADLTLILWASGLQVVSGWCIATETDVAMKVGNYVKGTVCLLLEKQKGNKVAFLDEIYPEVEDEVKKELDSMLALDDKEDPNFGDADYQLAAYSAALRVLTRYRSIEDIDIEYELSKDYETSLITSPVIKVIENAVRIATEFLVPKGLNPIEWKKLTPIERFYLKGLDIEAKGEYRSSVFQELARGFGIKEYTELLANDKANKTRLKTASEFGRKSLNGDSFGSSISRYVLFAIYEANQSENVQDGKNWLRNEIPDYWEERKLIMHILEYLASMGTRISHWKKDGETARLLKGAVENDHI